jgi:ligand-binding sensor domain-containing protein
MMISVKGQSNRDKGEASIMRFRSSVFLACLWLLFAAPLGAGAQWELSGNPGGGRITSFAVKGSILFATTRDGGVFLSIDNGATWRSINTGLPAKTACQCVAVSDANILVGTREHGVFLSTNNGGWWKAVNTGLSETQILSLAADGANLFAGTSRGVFRSGDNGASWTAVDSGLPRDFPVNCLVISNGNLAVGSGGKAFLSMDNGVSWKAISSGLPKGAQIFCLAVGETDLFAGTEMNGIFVSMDNGGRWKPIASKVPETEIHCLLFIGAKLLAGTGGGVDMLFGLGETRRIYHGVGVLLSMDKGAHWTAINSGLRLAPNLEGRVAFWIECLAVNGSFLFASTQEGEVWRFPLSDLPHK